MRSLSGFRSALLSPLLLLLLLLPRPASAQTDPPLPTPVAQALKSAGIPATAVALLVQNVDAHQPRLAFQEERAMNPASVMKLLTTYAGLEILGPAHVWQTEAYTSGVLREGVLEGDLILKGGGDPKLDFSRFWLLLRRLRAMGLQTIRGDLVLDRQSFPTLQHDPAGFDGQPLRPYNVGPDALLLNFKSIRLGFRADAASGRIALSSEPTPAQLDIVNLLKASQGSCPDNWYEAIRMETVRSPAATRLVLEGSFPIACGERFRHVAVLDHPDFVFGVFRELWQELGGTFQGNLRTGPVPVGAQLLNVHESAPLAEAVHDINKFSNNVMARQLWLAIGARLLQRPASPADSRLAVQEWLARHALAMPELVIENGSGLSRTGRISARSLARLLQAAWASPVMPEFIASLPVAGIDGTMRKRLTDNGVSGRAHVKTGYLEGARALAGYVLDRKGRRVIVVFLVNHPQAIAAKPAMDALLTCVWARTCG